MSHAPCRFTLDDLLQVLVARVGVVDVVVERGVVDEDVDGAEPVDGRGDARVGRRGLAEMSVCTKATSPRPSSSFIAELGAVLVDLGDDDLGALGEEALGVAEPDALAGAGDDRDLALAAGPRQAACAARG